VDDLARRRALPLTCPGSPPAADCNEIATPGFDRRCHNDDTTEEESDV
jgi:hypothetical protein